MFLSRQHQQWCCLFYVQSCGADVLMGLGTGGKARQVEFRVGLGLVGALCLAWGSAGKRGWLVWTGLHGTPVRFPSCLTRHSFPSVIFAAFPLVFSALRAPSAPALQSVLGVIISLSSVCKTMERIKSLLSLTRVMHMAMLL